MILKTRKKQLKRSKIDKLKEECGVFGISDHSDASALVALGLHALQHRGQEGCGIVSFDGESFHSEKRQGLVGDHFTKGDTIKKLPGSFAIGHNRYSTTGETSLRNIQPFFADLCSYMRSGPVMVQVLEGEDAIATNRRLMGATNPAEAAPGTIRADFAESIDANAVHGSDAPQSAAREIAFFFSADELQDRDA